MNRCCFSTAVKPKKGMEPAQMATGEDSFSNWAQGPGKTEEQRCENAIKAIRNAIDKCDQLNHRNIDVFVQGSYRNRVTVRQDSDVDVGVVCHDVFFYELPKGYTKEQFGLGDSADYKYSAFKNELQAALVSHFGSSSVHRGNKAFDIKENSYRVEADVAPFFDYRYYHPNTTYFSGVKLLPDNGGVVVNWPEQHYQNGVSKNAVTNRRFKRLVRILKHLAIHMADDGNQTAEVMPGFFIECLVWSVPNQLFANTTYTEDVRDLLVFLYQNTKDDQLCKDWTEVNNIKYLFHPTQKWTRQNANDFTLAAWQYLGFS